MNALEIIALAQADPEFQKFSAEFDTWSLQCWLGAEEKALHFGIAAYGQSGGTLVELGTLEGASALFSAAGLRRRGGGKLYSVDPHLGAPPFLGSAPWQFTYEKFRQNVTQASLDPYVHSILSDSQVAASIWPGMPVDSVLIDADHSYNGCLRDVESWAVKLKTDGFLLVDDANDPALPELLLLIEDLKLIDGLVFEALVDGIAVFRRSQIDGFRFLENLRKLKHLKHPRPWDMEFIQSLEPNSTYQPERLKLNNDLLSAYQLGFLARCERGDYGISQTATSDDERVVDALVADRQDGKKVRLAKRDESYYGFRFVICPIEDAGLYAKSLLPGGVLIARSSLPVDYQNSVEERTRLIAAGLEGCGWSEQIHWGFSKPHYLSADAILGYIAANMSRKHHALGK